MYELRAKSKTESEMLMYGSISEWGRVRAVDLFDKISDVKSKGYERLKLKIHCPGGSQFEGLAILSQMATKDIYIIGTVEGIAASMGAVILQGCHWRQMVKGTRLMVHEGTGGIMGSANQIRDYADLVASMNKTLAEIISKRSKRDAEYILKNWMTEGKDTWFTAEQALKEGLIDEIIDGNVVPLEKEQASLVELAAHYDQFLDKSDTTQSAMNKETKEKLIKDLGLKAEATDAEILAAVTGLKSNQKETEPTKEKTTSEGNQAAIDVIMIVAKERGVSEEMLENLKKVAGHDVKLAMSLIPEKKKEETETGKGISLNELIKTIKGESGGSAPEDRKTWTFADWEKKDSNGLLTMAKDKPEEYMKLFNAHHKTNISVDEVKKLV